jgi:hypothetical protein
MLEQELHSIYGVILEEGIYVGRTNNIPRRMSEHGYPPNWVVFEVVEKQLARVTEAKWAKKLSEMGITLLNIADNFSNSGGVLTHGESTRKLLSEKQKGIPRPEHSQRMKEVWKTPEYRALMKLRPLPSNLFQPGCPSPRKGGHREDISPEVRERMRINAKKRNDEKGNPRQGVVVTQKTRDKISKANKGRAPHNKHNQEICDKVVLLRNEGKTYKEIRKILEISEASAYEIFQREKKKTEENPLCVDM